MFNKNNFCHIASNNRNGQKAGIFVYKTTDDLATVLTSGYFNEKLVDINLHDLIIHVKRDAVDRTKVERNLLCVVERTLDNVGTILIKSNWEKTIEETIADIQTIINSLDDTYVRIDGTSIITGPLKMRSSVSFKCAIAPSWDGVGFYKLNDNDSLTLIASIETTDGLCPASNNTYNIGKATHKWKDAHIARVITAVINNGYDIAVPVTNSADTLALKSEVDLAANSGDQLYSTGVWYAKMYAATVVPTGVEYDGRNYADFSQVDSDNNPIIVIYTGASGAWTETTRITPPADYNGYMTITSKIWDIAEQSGQQGGKVLWSHNQKTFTPYPQIISFENAALTGVPTAPLPTDASPNNQIATKEYVDSHSSTGGYHPDLFAWEWSDALRNDVQWLRADTFSWQQGSVYKAAYKHLRNDTYNWYSWENNGTTIYTKKAYPEVGEKAYSNSALTTEVGEITAVTDTLDITVEKITVNGVVYNSVTGSNIAPTTETVGGVTVQYIPAEDGHKIVTDFHISEVEAVYAATGEAWYYIIDYGFKRFKLPRAKHNKYASTLGVVTTATRSTTAMPTLTWSQADGTNITSTTNSANLGVLNGHTNIWGTAGTGWPKSYDNIHPDNLIAQQTQDTDQYKYLYFYVGEFTQEAIENTAGINTEDFNDKADTDFGNTNMIDYVVDFQTPTAQNNYTWYRKYADGWVEQGGYVDSASGEKTVNFPVTMSDTYYTILKTMSTSSTNSGIDYNQVSFYSRTTTSAKTQTAGVGFSWQVSGMSAS